MATIFQSPWPRPSTPRACAVRERHRARRRGSPRGREADSSGDGCPGSRLARSPTSDAGKRDDVGQQVVVEVDEGQDEERGEQAP